MIEILNLHKHHVAEPYDFLIDRSTPVGNPHPLGQEYRRAKVCDLYEAEFEEMMRSRPGFMDYLLNIQRVYRHYGRVRLLCWCAPRRCHGETIKAWLEAQE